MMSHDHISLGVLHICYLENDRTAVLVVVTERVSAMELAKSCGAKICDRQPRGR